MALDTNYEPGTPGGTGVGAGRYLAQAASFAERSVRELFRNRAVLFWSLVFPVGFYLLTITVFVDTTEIPSTVLPYVKAATAVGYGMFGAIVACLNAFGQQLAADLDDGRYRLYRSLPISPAADLVGRMVAGFVLSLAALVVAIGVAALTGGTFAVRSLTSIPIVVLAVLTFAIFWMVVAVIVATAVSDTRYAGIVTVSLALAAYFLTGYNGGDPSVFHGPDVLLNWLPNTLATRLVTHHLVVFQGEAGADVAASLPVPGDVFGLGVLGLYAIGSLLVGIAVMRRSLYGLEVLP